MTPPAATAVPGARALPRTAAPRAPRRVSGPAARNRRDDSARRARTRGATTANDPFVVKALHRGQRMADSRFLDRLIRGRLWIPVVAAALMGIVFMQVTMLKFNAGIGRAVTSEATLEQQNSSLRADVSRLEAGSRIDAVAHDLGMVVPADGTTTYVKAARGQAREAATKMTPADPAAVQRAQAGSQLAAGQAAGTLTTGSATAAPTPAQAQAQAATGTAAPTTPTAPSTTGAGTATATGLAATSTAAGTAPTGGTATTASTTTGTGTGTPTATGAPSTSTTSAGGTAAAGTTAAAAGTPVAASTPTTQQTGAATAPQG